MSVERIFGGMFDIQFVRINATAIGDNTVLAGVANKRIQVLGYLVEGLLAVNIQFKSTPSGVIHARWRALGPGLRD